MAGTIHGLESEDLFFNGCAEHVLFIMLPVTRCFPQIAVVNIGSDHFLKSAFPILLLNELLKNCVNVI